MERPKPTPQEATLPLSKEQVLPVATVTSSPEVKLQASSNHKLEVQQKDVDLQAIERLREELSRGEGEEVIDIPDILDTVTPSLEKLKENQDRYRDEYQSLTQEGGKLDVIARSLVDVEVAMDQAKQAKKQEDSKISNWLGWFFSLWSKKSETAPEPDEVNASSEKSELPDWNELRVEWRNLILQKSVYQQRAQQLESYFHLLEQS